MYLGLRPEIQAEWIRRHTSSTIPHEQPNCLCVAARSCGMLMEFGGDRRRRTLGRRTKGSTMKLDADIRVGKLVDQYPFLLETLTAYSDKFSMLRNPLMRKTIGQLATLGKAAQIGGVALADLLETLAGAIREHTGESVEVDASAVTVPPTPDLDPARTGDLPDEAYSTRSSCEKSREGRPAHHRKGQPSFRITRYAGSSIFQGFRFMALD